MLLVLLDVALGEFGELARLAVRPFFGRAQFGDAVGELGAAGAGERAGAFSLPNYSASFESVAAS